MSNKQGYFKDPISNDKFLPESQGGGASGGKWDIYVAASDAPARQKAMADYQCDGVNDEVELQQAVDAVYAQGGGVIRLSKGVFYIDDFPKTDSDNDGNSKVAILIPSGDTGYEIRIIGDTFSYGNANGTRIVVSDDCYEGLNNSTPYKIFKAKYYSSLMSSSRVSVFFENLTVKMPWNQKKIICFDLRNFNRVFMQTISCAGYISGYRGGWTTSFQSPPPVAVQGCIGIRMTGGSNYGTLCDYRNIGCSGFYEAFQVGGEHVIMINCSGIWNYYSYTFGNYDFGASGDVLCHPITLINCCDERSVNLPLFANCDNKGSIHPGGQEVDLIGFNVERRNYDTPGGTLGDFAKESTPGMFHGRIIYTIAGSNLNATNIRFWEHGHGHRFESRDSTQLLATTKSVLATYAPNYLQKVWLTDENKLAICTDTQTPTWRDALGNIISLS